MHILLRVFQVLVIKPTYCFLQILGMLNLAHAQTQLHIYYLMNSNKMFELCFLF